MAYLIVEDFKAGLDRRKSILTAPAGSLWTARNGHITRGGEFEKRKAFVAKYALPAGTFGCQAAAGQLYVFGSGAAPGGMPARVNYQQLAHPTAVAMTGVLFAENFNGKIYAIASYADGSIYHFYNGARVTDWDAISTGISSNAAIANRLALLIDADPAYVASSSGSVVTISAQVPGVAFTIAQTAVNGGATNDQSITLAQVQANQAAVAGAYATGGFTVASGSTGGGNSVLAVTVNGVDILGVAVPFNGTAAQTASDVASAINTKASSPEYTATAVGAAVTIQAATIGAGPNGFVVAATGGGNVTISGVTNMAGGVTAVAAQEQIHTATIGGTFEAADKFTITIDGKGFVTTGAAPGMGTVARTLNSKVYSVAQSLLEFCALNTPGTWTGTGSGNINMANQDAGSEALTALGIYNGQLVIFARQSCQIWSMDTDPANNKPVQVLPRIGTFAPASVVGYGDSDVFFLSDTGVRSLRIRAGSSTAIASLADVGTSIDPIVIEALQGASEATANAAAAVVDPVDGRYMLAIGGIIYVFSYFPGAKISAWTTYEPGFTVQNWAVIGKRVYCRAGDTIYLYGGDSGTTYDSSQAELVLPYLSASSPATFKDGSALDAALEGQWDVFLGTNPSFPDAREIIARVDRATFALQSIPLVGYGPHFGLRFVNEAAGYARISNAIIHYQSNEAS
jgi:hypothetical protein